MIWKLLGLQRKLDALFDDSWGCLGLPHTRSSQSLAPLAAAMLAQPQA